MISLRRSKREELETFDEMDRQDHARNFVIQTGIESHQEYFDDPGITYLSIENANGEFCGYFILVPEPDNDSAEFRRILVDGRKRGIGQAAISEMESYCKNEFRVNRIWLDSTKTMKPVSMSTRNWDTGDSAKNAWTGGNCIYMKKLSDNRLDPGLLVRRRRFGPLP